MQNGRKNRHDRYKSTQLKFERYEDRVVPALVITSASGSTSGDIIPALSTFQSTVGTLNPNQTGSFGSGRREINWDAVPAKFASPNSLPADFFNVNSPRGVVMSTPGSGFQVSGNTADAGTGQPALEFANLNASYPTLFNAFSAQRLFTPVGSNQIDVTFFVPGTNIPAVTRAFGVVFSDVDVAGTTALQFFDASGNSLIAVAASPTFPTTNGGFSFLGAFDDASASIARVRLTFGNTAVGADEAGFTDIVVADDFIFGEPIAAPAPPTIGDVGNQVGIAGASVGPVAFTVGDVNTPAGQLALTATSSNTALIPNGNVTFGGSGANRTVILNPIAGQTGTATITLTVTDSDGQTATDSFDVTISPANTNPVINDVQNTTAPFGGFSTVTPFFVSDAETPAANLTVTAVSSNLALVSNSGVVLGGSGTNRTFFIAPNAGQTGTATITLTVSDGNGGSASDTFDVTVAAPAALPALPTGVTVSEAAGANAGSIQSAVDAFRTLIGGGTTAGAAGSFGGIRREINWDGVPAAKENPFPGDFFNTTSPRGVLLSSSGTALAVSGAVGTAGFEFGNLNANLPTEFSSFSSPKLFTALGTTTYDVTFRVAGTQIPAGVRSFGAVFTDVDLANVSKLEFFDAAGNLILSRDVLPTGTTSKGLSFLGVQLPAGTLAAKVLFTTGNVPIDSATTTPPGDVVAVDDFIFSEPVALPPAVKTDLFAVGTGPGVEAQVNVFNSNALLRFALFPFPGFTGGVNVTTGDVTGDGFDDIAVAAGPGGGPHVKVFDGQTGAEIRSFFAYAPDFRGGVFVGLGDSTGDLRAEIVTGTGVGGGPHVKQFDGVTNAELRSFFAYDPDFRGGVTVRAGDVSGDGLADIVTGAGPGGGPHVKVFDAKTNGEIQSFFAGDPESRGGVFVGVADFLNTGKSIVTVSANGKVFAPGYIEQDNAIPVPTTPGNTRVPVAAFRTDTGIIAILIGAAPGTRPTFKITDGTSNTVLKEIAPFGDSFLGGVNVG